MLQGEKIPEKNKQRLSSGKCACSGVLLLIKALLQMFIYINYAAKTTLQFIAVLMVQVMAYLGHVKVLFSKTLNLNSSSSNLPTPCHCQSVLWCSS